MAKKRKDDDGIVSLEPDVSVLDVGELEEMALSLRSAGYRVEPPNGPGMDCGEPVLTDTDPGYVLPKEQPLPKYYEKPGSGRGSRIPCVKCRRIMMPDLRQAVLCLTSGQEVAWFECIACGERFSMPVAKESS